MYALTRFTFMLILTAVMVVGSALPSHAQTGSLASLFGQSQKSKFLPVHQAFNVSAKMDGDVLSVAFKITPEHYIYQDKLTLALPDGVAMADWQFDQVSTMMDDPTFGQVAVFETDVVATTRLTAQKTLTDAPISIKWQGCAKAGLCYPPETVKININLSANPSAEPAKAQVVNQTIKPQITQTPQATTEVPQANHQAQTELDAPTQAPSSTVVGSSEHASSPIVALSENATPEMSEGGAQNLGAGAPSVFSSALPNSQGVDEATPQTPAKPVINHVLQDKPQDPFGMNENPWVAVGTLFVLGLLLALTPCVYPMIPIVANIVARHHAKSAKQGLILAGSYGLGVASAYGLLGMIIAWFGQALGIMSHLQNPYVLGAFALMFVLFALGMFDVIRLRLPSNISQALQQKSQSADRHLGSVGGSFVVGLLSALVVSPCVSLPMAGALSAVATTGNVLLGFVALFMLGLGLSVPLVVMGVAQGKFMPKSGAWTLSVKEFCGLLLLAVAVSLVERFWVSGVVLALWALWFTLVAVWLYRLSKLPTLALSLVSALWAGCLMVGASMGSTDPWRPLALLTQNTADEAKSDLHITTLGELDEILTKHDKVLVDITATWCVECRIMERTLFTNRPSELSDYQVVKLDITDTTEDSRAVLARYGLFGPPALLIYQKGQLKNVLLGEVAREDFVVALGL